MYYQIHSETFLLKIYLFSTLQRLLVCNSNYGQRVQMMKREVERKLLPFYCFTSFTAVNVVELAEFLLASLHSTSKTKLVRSR